MIRFRSLTVGFINQTVNVIVVGRFVTISLTVRSVVRRWCHPAAGRRRRLHHAERGVRTYVVFDTLGTTHIAAHPVLRVFSTLPQRGRRVLDLPVCIVTRLSLYRATAVSPRVM